MNFRVGQKVVCVDAVWRGGQQDRLGIPCPLKRGQIYTIRQIAVSWGAYRDTTGPQVVLDLNEVSHPDPNGLGFAAARFRPAATRKTDISIFKAMLNPQKLRTNA